MNGCFNYAVLITATAAVTPAAPVVAGAKPTTLVNTGPGDVAAMAAGSGLVGSFGYRRFLSRRLAK